MDVQELDNAPEILEQLRPVRFRYSDDYRDKHPSVKGHLYTNFIAQEFAKVFPDSVKMGGDSLLQVDSYPVRPYLVAALQELSGTVRELEAQNEELRRRLEALEAVR